jgi:hypothetical protein
MDTNKKIKNLGFVPGSLGFKLNLRITNEAKVSYDDYINAVDVLKNSLKREPTEKEVRAYLNKSSAKNKTVSSADDTPPGAPVGKKPEQQTPAKAETVIDKPSLPKEPSPPSVSSAPQKEKKYGKRKRIDYLDVLDAYLGKDVSQKPVVQNVSVPVSTQYLVQQEPTKTKEELEKYYLEEIEAASGTKAGEALRAKYETQLFKLSSLSKEIDELNIEIQELKFEKRKDLYDRKREELRDKKAEYYNLKDEIQLTKQKLEKRKSEILNLVKQDLLESQQKIEKIKEKITSLQLEIDKISYSTKNQEQIQKKRNLQDAILKLKLEREQETKYLNVINRVYDKLSKNAVGGSQISTSSPREKEINSIKRELAALVRQLCHADENTKENIEKELRAKANKYFKLAGYQEPKSLSDQANLFNTKKLPILAQQAAEKFFSIIQTKFDEFCEDINKSDSEIETALEKVDEIVINVFSEFFEKETGAREVVDPSVLQRKVGGDFMSENRKFSHKRIIKEMKYSDYENEEREPDHEYDMARNQLKTAVRAAKKIYKHVKNGEGEMESWVQSKLTLAANYLSTVADYLCSDSEEDLEEPDRNMYENKNLDSFIGKAANEPRNNKAMATIEAYKRAAKEIAAKAAEKGMRDALAKDYMKLVTDINKLNDKSTFAQLNDVKSRLAQLADRVDF